MNPVWSHLYVKSNEQNKLMGKIETESWARGTDWQQSVGIAGLDEEGEGISQRTHTHDPQTQATVWWWPEGRGGGRKLAKCGEMGKSPTVSTIKIKKIVMFNTRLNHAFINLFS